MGLSRTCRISLLFLTFFCFSSFVNSQNIVLTHSREKSNFGLDQTEYFFDATVNGIPLREVRVNGYLQTNSVGTVILSSGGKGQSYYSSVFGEEAQELIRSLHTAGYEVFEIRYDDPDGWAKHCEGIGGYRKAVQIYSEMLRHLHADYFVNKDLVFASGNSGGSFQIAFGLTNYNLEDILDMVVLTGGPPISSLKNGIFGDNSLPERWPTGVAGGFVLTDFLMGWTNEMYCVNRSAPDSIIDILDTVSLAANSEFREYHYTTMVNFVQSEDPSNAHHQAKIYFDSIKTEKAWYSLADVDVHAVPSSFQGAQKIKELILDYNGSTSNNDPIRESKLVQIYPNPSSGVVNIELASTNENFQLEILDISGRTIRKWALSSSRSQFSFKPKSGLYFGIIKDNSSSIKDCFRLIVN